MRPPGPEQPAPDSAPGPEDDVTEELRDLEEREGQVDATSKAGVGAAEAFLGSKASHIKLKTDEQLNPEIVEGLKQEGVNPKPKDVEAVQKSIEAREEADAKPPPSEEEVNRELKEITALALKELVAKLQANSSSPAKQQEPPKKSELEKGTGAALNKEGAEQGKKPLKAEPEDTSGLGDAVLDFMSEAAGILGFVGTGGKTNMGLNPVLGGADNDGPLEKISNPFEYIFQFGQRAEGTASEKKTNETLGYMSGTGDIAAGGTDIIVGVLAVKKLVARLREIKAAWKDPETTPAERAEMRAEAVIISMKLSKLSVGFAQSGMVIAGGITNIVETAGKTTSVVKDGVDTSPTFGLNAPGGNSLATEFKLSGDIIGILGSYIGAIIQGAELGAKIASGEFTKGNKKEVAGRIAMEISKTIQSATKAGKSVGDVVAQISDGGQIIAEGSKAVLGAMGQAIGGIGAGIAVLDIARQGYLINKFRNRKKALKAAAVGLTLEENQQAALDFICQTLTKRQKRAAREIFFDSLNVVGGVLTATGMGSAAGIAISATALTLKLGHAAFKFTRQRLRNYLAKKREHLESYAEWSARQKAIKGGLAGKKAFMKRVFMPNWDKSTDKKAAEYTQHAQTVLGLLEQHPTLAESALHGLGVATNAKGLAKFKKLSEEKKFKSIVDAMKKR